VRELKNVNFIEIKERMHHKKPFKGHWGADCIVEEGMLVYRVSGKAQGYFKRNVRRRRTEHLNQRLVYIVLLALLRMLARSLKRIKSIFCIS